MIEGAKLPEDSVAGLALQREMFMRMANPTE